MYARVLISICKICKKWALTYNNASLSQVISCLEMLFCSGNALLERRGEWEGRVCQLVDSKTRTYRKTLVFD